MATRVRKTAEERREQILDAARHEFALRGLEGASTDAIAREVGISQPYLFRLFGTKKELFVKLAGRCLEQTRETFAAAAEGKSGREALDAMGKAYLELIDRDPEQLRAQMQGYAACDDPEVCAVMRAGFGRLVELAEATGAPPEAVSRFFSHGMLLNVVTMMDLQRRPEPWAERLVAGCYD